MIGPDVGRNDQIVILRASRTPGRVASHAGNLCAYRAIVRGARIDGQRMRAWTRRVAAMCTGR